MITLSFKNNIIILNVNIFKYKIKKIILIFQLILRNEIKIIIEYILNVFNNENAFITDFFIFELHLFKIHNYCELLISLIKR